MGAIGLVLGLFTAGYIIGVWTGGVVFRQPQAGYEDAAHLALSATRLIALGSASYEVGMQRGSGHRPPQGDSNLGAELYQR
jgi:hypothetical protein